MFTGIIEEVGVVDKKNRTSLRVTSSKAKTGLKLGDSVAVNGVCLTVTALSERCFDVDIMEETVMRSSLGELLPGELVNLERAVMLGDRLGGHLVQGHIDAVGKIESIRQKQDSLLVAISAPGTVMRYVVEKGFIAVDGISLTVVECNQAIFTVSVVGYTLHNTTLSKAKLGRLVNLEADVVGKYIEKFTLLERPRMTEEFLTKHGYLS